MESKEYSYSRVFILILTENMKVATKKMVIWNFFCDIPDLAAVISVNSQILKAVVDEAGGFDYSKQRYLADGLWFLP